MTTSSSTDFELAVDDYIEEAFERCGLEIRTGYDLKTAKRLCNKDQKVIKVPNTDVFKIVAPILISRGISRIVNSEQLIAL